MNKTLLLIAVVLLGGCHMSGKGTPSLGTLEVHRISITADSNEPIVELAVKEGDAVKPGEVLMRQDPTRIKAELDKAEAAMAAADAAMQKAQNGPRPEDIAAARANVAAAASDANTVKLELDREKSLVKHKFASQNDVDVLAGQYDSALAHKRAVAAGLAELLAGTRAEDIAAARANYALAKAAVENIKVSLARTTITSPIHGKVESIIERVGERPGPGEPVMVLVQDEKPFARVNVPEPLRTRLEPGARAEVYIDGHDKPYPGKLRWIAHDASYTPFFALTQHDRSHLSYIAEVVLTGDAGKLPTGVPVQVYFPGVE